MYISNLEFKNHPILKNIYLDFINPKTKKPFSIIAFVGENGCGKTTILNEIFDYNKSEHIVKDDETITLCAMYLRQNSVHKNTKKEIIKLINGKDTYFTHSKEFNEGKNYKNLRMNNNINNKTKGLEILKNLGDKQILDLYESNGFSNISCSGEASNLIKGGENIIDIENYSSGQQEILLKLKDIATTKLGTDVVLIDEPEASLHPRWQREIINILLSLFNNDQRFLPQVFIATHSDKVLESLVNNDNALIIGLIKKNNIIKAVPINNAISSLPFVTISEINYLFFHIPSFEYNDLLINRIADSCSNDSIKTIDNFIKKNKYYDREKHSKRHSHNIKDKEFEYETLPIFIRNYYHHPNNKQKPTEDDLEASISLLRKIISSI